MTNKKLKNELALYLRIQKVDTVKTMNSCIYVLDNLDSKKDIAYNDTIKTFNRRVWDNIEYVRRVRERIENNSSILSRIK